MRQLPILFSTPMVKAILDDKKKMTRRTAGLEEVNENPENWKITDDTNNKGILFFNKSGFSERMKPRYQVGDHLWVRETYFSTMEWKHAPLFTDSPDYIYRADEDAFIGEHKWKPSLFMPKAVARIWLECTGVRCERLQDITGADAIAEGILPLKNGGTFDSHTQKYFDYSKPKQHFPEGLDPFWSFNSLWCSINGSESWDANPWVFVYEFKRIEKP